MKRFAAALMIAGAGLMAGAAVVDAYPPGSATVLTSTIRPEPGGTFTVTVNSCLVGETVNFLFEGQSPSSVCAATGAAGLMLGFLTAPAQSGTAFADLTAPTAPGTYNGTATMVTSNVTLDFSVTVEAAATTTLSGELPSTGSSSSGTALTIAVLLLLGGASLFGVAQVRRRRELTV